MTSKDDDLKIKQIQRQCETHEHFLKELVRGRYASPKNYLSGGLCLGIARRWNSWYPSYFKVKGGCYVLIPGDLDPDNEDNKKDSRIGVIAIDPGFKFIDILRANHQIEPQDISTIIVTHFHPDHMAGLLEYATIMNTSKKSCNVYLNETSFATFKSLQNAYITINELLDEQIQEVMCYVTKDKKFVRVTVKAIGVHHNELGNQHRSLGLILEITLSTSRNFTRDLINRYRIGILGDTDGNEEYMPFYVDNFREVDILILHLGTFSDKKWGRGGKHLYIKGVKQVLERIGEELNRDKGRVRKRDKIVVLSEFGLELADEELLYHKLQPSIESHFWRLPLIFANLYLKEQRQALKKGSPGDDMKVSRFFASATLAILKKIYQPSENVESLESVKRISQQALTKKEKDELLLALGFQVLALDSANLRSTVRDLQSELDRLISKQKEKGILDGLPLKQYLDFLEKELQNNPDISPLQEFFKDLLAKASFTQVSSPFIKHLVKSCESLIEEIVHNLEDFSSVFYYIDKLDYISKYAESRGIKNYRWVYGKGPGIKDLSLFWNACLIGVFLLREVLQEEATSEAITEVIPSEPKPTSECLLLQIGDFFRKYSESWANLLVGDIGCTFGLDPFKARDSKERDEGIKLKSVEGKWISPYDAECFYDKKNDRISYRIPED